MTALNKTFKKYLDMILGTSSSNYSYSDRIGFSHLEEIVKKTSEVTGVPVNDIMSHRINSNLVYARYIAMFLAYELTTLSYVSIGRAMNRDHTSVMHAIKKLNNRGRGKSKVNTDMVKIKQLLANG